MKITAADTKHLAELAGLSPDAADLETLSADLDRIVTYFDEMNQLDTTGVEPTYQVTGLFNVWRSDVVAPHLNRATLLDLAPASRDNCVEVPPVF